MLWRTVSYWRNKKAEVMGYRGSLISRKTYFKIFSIWNYYMYLKIDYRNLTLLFLVYLDAAELLVPTHHTLEKKWHNRLEYSTKGYLFTTRKYRNSVAMSVEGEQHHSFNTSRAEAICSSFFTSLKPSSTAHTIFLS